MNELIDPDEEQQAQFGWDEEFQRNIIALLMTDRSFLIHAIDLIKPNYFTNKAHQASCDIIFNFFKKYNTSPSRVIVQQEIKNRFKEDKSALFYEAEITALYDFFEPSIESREYFTDKIAFFAKIQAIRKAFNKSLNLIGKAPEEEETWSSVYELLRQAMNTDKNFDKGLEYFLTLKERYDRMNDQEKNETERFVTGYEGVDSEVKGNGYLRGELISIVGGSGVGKSVVLSCIAAANVLRGKRCLYISLELSEDRVAERFDSIMSESPIKCLYDNKEEIFQQLEKIVENKQDKNMIIIKHFPSSSADINTLRAYMAQIKFYGLIPDLVIVDYVGEMKDYPGPIHDSRERIVKELRGLAEEENVFMATAMQPNRGSKEAQKLSYIDEAHLADSFGQIRPLDGCISINQNDEEKAAGVGRLWVMKQRNGKAKYFCYVKFDPETLKIYEISHETYKNLLSKKQASITESIEIDKLHEKGYEFGSGAEEKSLAQKIAYVAANKKLEIEGETND